jgi:putative transposase
MGHGRGKGRMRGDTKREATLEEVRQLREENERLNQLVAELSLTNLTLKKPLLELIERRRHGRMGAERKWEVIHLMRRSPLPKASTLEELGIPRLTFFRRQRRLRQHGEVGLVDRRPDPGRVWNRLMPLEEETILREALQQPELSPHELACWVTDHGGFSVSESSVDQLLKRHGLIHEVEVVGFPAWKEYRVKTTRINEHWQSDASYFLVVGWGNKS